MKYSAQQHLKASQLLRRKASKEKDPERKDRMTKSANGHLACAKAALKRGNKPQSGR